MNILAFSDFHANPRVAKRASQIVSEKGPDVVMVAGDIGQGDREKAVAILQMLSAYESRVFFVPGNIDDPELANLSSTDRIFNLHGRSVDFEGVSFVGLGGAPVGPFDTPFEYDEAQAGVLLREAVADSKFHRWVLLSHSPPRNCKLDLAWIGSHIGSTAVSEIIEEKNPIAVISGHVHEAAGLDDLHGVPLVNVGSALHGSFAAVTIDDRVEIELEQMQNM
jgi:hypothetical protein